MNSLHRPQRALVWLSLASALLAPAFLSAAQAVPPPAASANAAATDLALRLGQVLRNLDQDQSHRLTRTGADDADTFQRMNLGQVAETINGRPDRAVVIFGKRGPLADAPLDLDSALLVPALDAKPATAYKLNAAARSRAAYQVNATDGSWASLLSTLEPEGQGAKSGAHSLMAKASTPEQALKALAKTRSAGFVFLLKKGAPSDALAVDKLIVVPDTVMINVSGNSTSETAPTTSAPQRTVPSNTVAIRPPSPPRPAPAPDVDMRARMEADHALHRPPPPMPQPPPELLKPRPPVPPPDENP